MKGFIEIVNKYTLEKDIEQYLYMSVKSYSGVAIKLVPLNVSGIPDRLVILPGGKMLFVELKRPGGKPRPLQKYWHEKLKSLGFRVEVIASKERVEEVLNDVVQAPRLSADG